ncbi:hypothetical protein QUA42_00485 [Microcoleus sp. Pol11C2]|uniref:hypothetical protein n=1 Tax=Microcoleus sp. Pol11C2 TaxID=3055389 RepID=UPI002FD600C2
MISKPWAKNPVSDAGVRGVILSRKQQPTAKQLSVDRRLQVATYAKDIQKPGFFLKLLGFNPEI